jgi:hypothetical protein
LLLLVIIVADGWLWASAEVLAIIDNKETNDRRANGRSDLSYGLSVNPQPQLPATTT